MTEIVSLSQALAEGREFLAAPRYSAERTLSLPDFWLGAGKTRAALDDERGENRARIIERKRAAGVPLSAIAEYRDWLGARRPR